MENGTNGHGLSKRGWSNVDSIMPRIRAQVAERQAKQTTNIDLSTAENWLIRDELVELCKDAIVTNLEARHMSYPRGFSGDPQLLEAYAAFFNQYFNPRIPVEPSHISTAAGAHWCIDSLLYNICDSGDGVMIPGPYWNGFDFGFKARAEVIPVLVELPDLESSFIWSLLSALEETYNNAQCHIRALMLTNPHNPLGQCYPKDLLEGCLRFCQRHAIHFISDEVYALTNFKTTDEIETTPFTSVLSLDLAALGVDMSRVHTVWSLSKDLGQSGFRMGCIITQANQEMVVGASLAANTQISALSTIFATSLLTSSKLPELIKSNSKKLGQAYGTLTTFLRSHGIRYIPCYAGLYVFAHLTDLMKSPVDLTETEMVQRLKEVGVIVSAGRAYHCPSGVAGWARIGFALPPQELHEAITRMDSVFRSIRKSTVTQSQ
ncbi:uncharacterized protein Z518_00670 [Rhinocladiella mackenziei CBS 650.93]|uniref:Rhinocladiella mackenziei CBS 650.93 unplaced genomic scaffold supercont1.1, whole genome shotgun sequence n=1 Tax=Rhinocladiella mackenziei CBS 650.93 TaxID=1442369 RepID=A0A0D2JJI9_9EURO|nr:uncharacterized protein Z518_00670 [Rhinocladiella mackenziei CBS 650.93]KIX09590.1 hypothetical protein Z518_00670 [Rhinocladiella mackenziei CBS 650.93]